MRTRPNVPSIAWLLVLAVLATCATPTPRTDAQGDPPAAVRRVRARATLRSTTLPAVMRALSAPLRDLQLASPARGRHSSGARRYYDWWAFRFAHTPDGEHLRALVVATVGASPDDPTAFAEVEAAAPDPAGWSHVFSSDDEPLPPNEARAVGALASALSTALARHGGVQVHHARGGFRDAVGSAQLGWLLVDAQAREAVWVFSYERWGDY